MITGDMIKALRAKLNESQHDFSRRFGVTNMTIYRWENGHRTVGKESIEKMKKLLDRYIPQA